MPLLVVALRCLQDAARLSPLDASLPVSSVVPLLSYSCVTGCLVLLTIGYCYVHCWHSGQAEVMGFADRAFYGACWSAGDAFRWMSVWNFPVQRWLTEYVYKPAAPLIGDRVCTVILVFLISGAAHDYILSFVAGFFVPVFSTAFATIVPLIPLILLIARHSHLLPLPPTNVNTFAVYILTFASAAAYATLESQARVACPPDPSSGSTAALFFLPRFPHCLSLSHTHSHEPPVPV